MILRMTDGVRAVLVYPRVQGGHIHIAYLHPLPSHSMQGHRACSTPKEGLAGFQGRDQIEGTKKLRHGRLVVYQAVPLTLPHFDDGVTRSEQSHAFGERGLIQFLHASVRYSIMLGVPAGIAAGTTMVETTMKLVDSTGQGIVPIHEIAVHDGADRLFTPVTDVSNAVGTGPLPGNLVFLVVEPLQGLEGLVDLGASSAPQRFDGDGVGGQMVLARIQIAGTGDGDAFGHGIETGLSFKFLLKGFTAGFQQSHIRFAVLDHFLLEIKGHITTDLIRVPTSQFLFLFGHHTLGIVKFQIGDAAHVLLVVGGIEQMRKEALL